MMRRLAPLLLAACAGGMSAPPGAPLVTRGVYRHLRHPNYVGIVGEVLGSAVWMHAAIAGTLFAVSFGLILLIRIRVEERALGLAPRA